MNVISNYIFIHRNSHLIAVYLKHSYHQNAPLQTYIYFMRIATKTDISFMDLKSFFENPLHIGVMALCECDLYIYVFFSHILQESFQLNLTDMKGHEHEQT